MSTKLETLAFYSLLNQNAYGKGEYFKEKVLTHFESLGFSEDESFEEGDYEGIEMSNERMILKYYQSDQMIAIIFFLSSQEEY